ncbi:amino acid/polyamine transporter I [Aspergillus granulosus]|uniref:Amino acid/polyamine transporter I n=1 Tax=Aspergillus granulosus TaxID=176169 RepID=A0ABR4HQK3_9EURO
MPPVALKASNEENRMSRKSSEIDDGTVEELGYVPVYRRVFRSAANMSMVIALTTPLSAIFVTANYQITYAGYWGLSWGWIIPSFLVLPEVLAISELASSMPVNGAFYWWSGALAPPRWSHSVSFITGCLNLLSIFTATAAFAYAVASSFSFSLSIAVPDMQWTNPQLMALSLGVIVLWSALMALRLEKVAVIYILMAVLILVQALIFTFGLPITHAVQKLPFASASSVFGEFSTYTDWSPSVAVPYSWFAALWVNSAWMVPVYVAEETHRASTEIPKSLIYTYSVTAVSGLVVCLLCAFCITDIEAAAMDVTGYPLFMLILSHWGQKISSAFFLFVSPVGFIGGSGTLLTYANQIAAFARDKGLPYSNHILYVHPRLNIPTYSVGLLAVGTSLVLLLSLSDEASNIIYSLSVVASLITFVMPILFRIFAGDRWVPGRFSLGRWSIPVHVLSLLSQIYIIVMECFPPYRAWTVYTFNYNSVVTVGAILLSCFLYLVYGRRHYRGLNVEALESWRRHHGVIIN